MDSQRSSDGLFLACCALGQGNFTDSVKVFVEKGVAGPELCDKADLGPGEPCQGFVVFVGG